MCNGNIRFCSVFKRLNPNLVRALPQKVSTAIHKSYLCDMESAPHIFNRHTIYRQLHRLNREQQRERLAYFVARLPVDLTSRPDFFPFPRLQVKQKWIHHWKNREHLLLI